ncbi:hypothetical protein [Myxococcus sp. AS-1-15]|uniref:hypothetical protein n=1 Tax=Myxococcus sp. AS-1-15 TaxID=2874600 RepID=UPI001CBDA309|nr:hypothetical protein [Myxococcus sp. AS-1-15]MBZ4401120.1 hypothetical protein [Myxococcus sp. AS-1-15]
METPGAPFPQLLFFNSLADADQKNMLVAISCNRKAKELITPRIARQLFEELEGKTSGQLGIFIADEVMKFNEMAMNMSEPKARALALDYGDHFESLFALALSECSEALKQRTHIFRWNEIETAELLDKTRTVEDMYDTQPQVRQMMDVAAAKLLAWRCPDVTPSPRRLRAILDFIFREVPIVGAWGPPLHVRNIPWHGLIYPAINPRGMNVITGLIAELDEWMGKTMRHVLVMHIAQEGSVY